MIETSTATSILTSGVSGLLINSLSGRSNFGDTTPTNTPTISQTTLIIVIVIVILFSLLFIVATYKLTGSVFQTILCILFGVVYIIIAYLYYAYAGYKYLKPKRS